MSYPQTVSHDYSAQGGGAGSGVSLAAFQSYQLELNALVAAAQEVNDGVTDTATTWSSTKIAAALAAI
jgi:hypothetical protein